MDVFFGLILLALGVCFYFLPSIVASQRSHPSAAGIAVLNLFLGWTLVGWVVALVWAVSSGSSAPKPTPEAEYFGDLRTCPECAEQILKAAKRCKHCGVAVEPVAGFR